MFELNEIARNRDSVCNPPVYCQPEAASLSRLDESVRQPARNIGAGDAITFDLVDTSLD